MKLLTEELLKEYGFTEKPHITNRIIIKVLTRAGIDIIIKGDGVYYTNLGFDYPLRDTAALRKLYKEIKSEELKPLGSNGIIR